MLLDLISKCIQHQHQQATRPTPQHMHTYIHRERISSCAITTHAVIRMDTQMCNTRSADDNGAFDANSDLLSDWSAAEQNSHSIGSSSSSETDCYHIRVGLSGLALAINICVVLCMDQFDYWCIHTAAPFMVCRQSHAILIQSRAFFLFVCCLSIET